MILVVSCSQNSDRRSHQQLEDKTLSKRADSASDDMEDAESTLSLEEEFSHFIEKFSKDENFQMKRIKFPISVIVPDTSHQGMAPMNDLIEKRDWELLDLSYDSTYLTRPFDQYYQVVNFKQDTAVVEIRGINNGIYADYYFSKIEDEWYLVTLYEASF